MQASATILETTTLQPRGMGFLERHKEARRINREKRRADRLAMRMQAREERMLRREEVAARKNSRNIRVVMDRHEKSEAIRINMHPTEEIVSLNNMTESDLINAESALGATIFGAIPEGHQREFFRFDHNVWIFHENWEEYGRRRESTIRYEVREDGVHKIPLGGQPSILSGVELSNFVNAAREYLKLVKSYLY